jgi:hypothetical protein
MRATETAADDKRQKEILAVTSCNTEEELSLNEGNTTMERAYKVS